MMIYSVNDKFIVSGILCEVKHVNRGKAWVAPVESNGELLSNVCFQVLDKKGRDTNGNKAFPVVNHECAAV